MQIDPQEYLDMAEATGNLCCFDIEATGLKGDYNSVLVVSVKPYDKEPVSFRVTKPGNDYAVVKDAKDMLEAFHCWVSFFGKGFDVKMLNTRLTRWELPPIEPRHHVDMFYTAKHALLTGRKSQAHLLRFFNCEKQKMDMSPSEWTEVLATGDLSKMIARCESDTEGLEALYKKTRHLIRDIKRG